MPESEHDRDRQADRVVPDHVGEEREARVARAAQHACADALDSVRELEHGAHRKQRNCQGNHVVLIGEQPCQHPWDEPEEKRSDRHHQDAAGERDQARSPRCRSVARADRPSDPHGPGLADANCGAEREARQRDRHLVRGHGARAEAAGEEADEGENADFGAHLQPDRYTDAQRLAEIVHARAARLAGADGQREYAELQERTDAGGEAGSGRAQRGKTELAEDEEDVEHQVRDVGDDGRDNQRPHAVGGL